VTQLRIDQPRRFDAYEVRPVVEEQISDGTSICHPYNSLNEAEAFIADSTGGQTGWPREGYSILWTLYGHRDGEGVEAISDLDNEQCAFDLLYSITGIRGVSGQTVYPLSDNVPLVDTNAALTKLASAIDAIDHYKLTDEVDSLALAEEAIGDAEALIQRNAVQDGVGSLQRIADAINRRLPDAGAEVGQAGGGIECIFAQIRGRHYLIGDANETWGASVFDRGDDRSCPIGEVDTEISCDVTDCAAIATALIEGEVTE
jgi:hypothetical protein